MTTIEDLAMFAEDCAATGDHRLLKLASLFFHCRKKACKLRLAGDIAAALRFEEDAERHLKEMEHEG